MPRLWIQVLAIVTITLGVYQAAPSASFMPIDDGSLTFKNPLVQSINLETLKGVFSTYDPELYVPLTMISYQIDYLLGGDVPKVYHITNLILHILNAVLVLLFIRQLTKKKWIPFLTAVLFAIHPLHTEAVMWVSSRKDLLSTVFYLSSVILYCKHRKAPTRKAYLGSITLFILGLLSKVNVVTLPLVLMIIDDLIPANPRENERLEKWAYYLPALAILFVGMFGKSLSVYLISYFDTFLLASKSSVFYLQKILVPFDLLFFYQQHNPIAILSPEFTVPLCTIIICLIITIASRSYTKIVSFAFLWYGITLLPNLANFTKWNKQSILFASDRYAYIPSIGIFFLLASAVVILYNNSRFQQSIKVITIATLVTLSGLAYKQSYLWITPKTLFAHVIRVDPHSSMAHAILGIISTNNTEYPDAIEHLRKTIDITPNFSDARSHLGLALIKNNQIEEGIAELKETINREPDYIAGHIYLAYGQMLNGNNEQARRTLDFALELQPNAAKALHLMGAIEQQQGNIEKARMYYEHSLKANPKNVQVKAALSRLLRNL